MTGEACYVRLPFSYTLLSMHKVHMGKGTSAAGQCRFKWNPSLNGR
jgi:hypothetical protein